MNYSIIQKMISEKITGEWGSEPKTENRVKVIRTTNFTNEGKLNLSNVVEREIAEKIVRNKKLRHGDIIIEKSGGSPNQPVGRVIYFDVEDNNTYLCNNFTSILRPREIISPKYFFYCLYYLHITKKTLNYQNKTTGIINLQLDRYLKNERIPTPSLKDQERIVKILDQVNNLGQKSKQSSLYLESYLKSIFFKMFGDPISNTLGWDKKPLKFFGEIITGNTPSRNDKDNYSSNFIEWIKTDNIVSGKIYVTAAKEYLSEKGFKKARFVEPGALLVACIAGSAESIGRASITDRKVSFNQQINAIQPNEKVNSIFLYWLFKLSKLFIQNQATKGMKKILTKGEFEKIVMIIPPIDIQNRFAQLALKAETVNEKLVNQSQELDMHFKSVMQKSFS